MVSPSRYFLSFEDVQSWRHDCFARDEELLCGSNNNNRHSSELDQAQATARQAARRAVEAAFEVRGGDPPGKRGPPTTASMACGD